MKVATEKVEAKDFIAISFADTMQPYENLSPKEVRKLSKELTEDFLAGKIHSFHFSAGVTTHSEE